MGERFFVPLLYKIICVIMIAFVGRSLLAQSDTSAYRRSLVAVARRQAADDRVAVPGARSILLTDSAPTARVIVLLHGLTDSPRQFETLADSLYAEGNTVYVPRLPQHGLRKKGTHVLSALTAAQLRGVADSIVNESQGLGDSIVVVGLSMGGAVGAWIAQNYQVARVVLIAPAIEPGRIPSLLDRPLIGLADRLPTVTRGVHPDTVHPDHEAGFNSHAAAEVFQLGSSTLHQASHDAPKTHDIVLLVNANDRTVRESAAEALVRNWRQHGANVSVYELPDSLQLPHNIVDSNQGRVSGEAVLSLLGELSLGDQPSALVRPIPMP